MPRDLARDPDRTVFAYGGIISPPRDWDRWTALVRELVAHLAERYGSDEVAEWAFEVWNEPNLGLFWDDAESAYLRLYDASAAAVKAVDPRFRVGGPATAAAAGWTISSRTAPRRARPSTSSAPTPTACRRSTCGRSPPGSAGRTSRCGGPSGASARATARRSTTARGARRSSPAACGPGRAGSTRSRTGWPRTTSWSWARREGLFHGGFGLLTIGNLRKPRFWAIAMLESLGTHEVACALEGDGAGSLVEAWASIDDDGRVAVACWNGTLAQTNPDGDPRLERRVALDDHGARPRRPLRAAALAGGRDPLQHPTPLGGAGRARVARCRWLGGAAGGRRARAPRTGARGHGDRRPGRARDRAADARDLAHRPDPAALDAAQPASPSAPAPSWRAPRWPTGAGSSRPSSTTAPCSDCTSTTSWSTWCSAARWVAASATSSCARSMATRSPGRRCVGPACAGPVRRRAGPRALGGPLARRSTTRARSSSIPRTTAWAWRVSVTQPLAGGPLRRPRACPGRGPRPRVARPDERALHEPVHRPHRRPGPGPRVRRPVPPEPRAGRRPPVGRARLQPWGRGLPDRRVPAVRHDVTGERRAGGAQPAGGCPTGSSSTRSRCPPSSPGASVSAPGASGETAFVGVYRADHPEASGPCRRRQRARAALRHGTSGEARRPVAMRRRAARATDADRVRPARRCSRVASSRGPSSSARSGSRVAPRGGARRRSLLVLPGRRGARRAAGQGAPPGSPDRAPAPERDGAAPRRRDADGDGVDGRRVRLAAGDRQQRRSTGCSRFAAIPSASCAAAAAGSSSATATGGRCSACRPRSR